MIRVPVDAVREAIDKLLRHAKDAHGDSVELDADLYWFVPNDVLHRAEEPPTGLTLGSLRDDLAELEAIADGSKEPIGYALVWASALLRAIGDRTI